MYKLSWACIVHTEKDELHMKFNMVELKHAKMGSQSASKYFF